MRNLPTQHKLGILQRPIVRSSSRRGRPRRQAESSRERAQETKSDRSRRKQLLSFFVCSQFLRFDHIESLLELGGVRQQALQNGGIAADLYLTGLLTCHQGKELQTLAGDGSLRIRMVLAGVRQQDAILTGYIELFIHICHRQIQSQIIVLGGIGVGHDSDVIQQHGDGHLAHCRGQSIG